jgi:hypothetical protein
VAPPVGTMIKMLNKAVGKAAASEEARRTLLGRWSLWMTRARSLVKGMSRRARVGRVKKEALQHPAECARSSMDRAPDYGSGGYRFKSCRARH